MVRALPATLWDRTSGKGTPRRALAGVTALLLASLAGALGTATDATAAQHGHGHTAAPRLPATERPPMGWSSWSSLHGDISESVIEAEAQAMRTTLAPYGYRYINIDAGWSDHLDANGRPTWNTTKFPHGIPALARYVHGLGLKLGIYLVPGIPKDAVVANPPIAKTPYRTDDIADTGTPGNTAADGSARIDYSKPGAAQYVQSEADLLASWGVDYIKMDFVGPGGGRVAADNRADVEHWYTALRRTGRPIHLELSNALSVADAATWQAYSNGWRIEGDVECYSHCPGLTSWNLRVARRFTDVPRWIPHASPGHWNDLDSVEVGNGDTDGLTPDERQSVITLWSVEAAPLLLGTDLTKLDPADLPLLTNREVIAVDQAGRPAHPVSQATPQQVWFRVNPDGSRTVALFNLGDSPATVSAGWADLGLGTSPALVRDLWRHQSLGPVRGRVSATLAPHASRLLRITPATG
jgi:hypothetical protein